MNLIAGRSGTGKTHMCIEQIRELTEAGSASGRVIFIVPEQFSLTAEVLLAESIHSRGGFMGTEVLSFTRLAHACLDELGTTGGKPLSTVSKIITLSDILADLRDSQNLTYYLRQSDRSSFASKLLSFVTEAKRYGITPQDLADFSSNAENSSLQNKFSELALIFDHYNARIHALGKDGDEDLTLLAQAIPNCTSLRNAQIWIDSFTDFSPAHMDIIRELALVCRQVTLTIPMDPTVADNDLFRKGNSTWLAVTEMCHRHSIPCSLTQLNQNHRHESGSQLNWIEANYGDLAPNPYTGEDDRVTLLSCSDPFVECTAVAEQILREVNAGHTHYGQIAVAAGSIADYSGIIQPIFEEYGIPYFFDTSDNISSAPLPICIVSALHGVVHGGDISDSLFTMLRTGLTDLTDQDIDILENYAIQMGIRYLNQWLNLDPTTEAELPAALPYLQELLSYLSSAMSAPMSAGTFAMAVANFMQKYLLHNCNATLEAMLAATDSPDSLKRADQFRQIWSKVLSVLDSLRTCTGDRTYSPRQLVSLLSAGLEASQVGSIPTGSDLVIISDINRIRSRSLPSVYIIGAQEGKFPPIPSPDGIIPDYERLLLRQSGIVMAPTTAETIYDKNYETYAALTLSTDKLTISYSCSDPQGRKLNPSSLITSISEGLGIKVQPGTPVISGGTAFGRFINALSANSTILGQIMRHYPRIPYGTPDPIPEEGTYASLWNTFIRHPEAARICTSLIAQYLRRQDSFALHNGVDPMALMGDVVSVTALEEYGNCPYRCYISRVLRVNDRKTCQLNGADLGSLVHELLCICGRQLSRNNSWDSIDSVEAARSYVAPLVRERLSGAGFNPYANTYSLFHGEHYVSTAVASALFACSAEIRERGYFPVAFELMFGSTSGIRPIQVSHPSGDIYLSGKIDRVDTIPALDGECIRVIDYKTGHTSLKTQDIYYGTSLQLPLYLKGYQEYMNALNTPVVPYSMGYMSLDGIETDQSQHLADSDRSQTDLCKNLFPSTTTHGDRAGTKDRPFTVDIPQIIAYSSSLAGEFGSAIRQGRFPVMPLEKDTCKYCKYAGLCAKDVMGCNYRSASDLPVEDMEIIINGIREEDGADA